MNILFIYSLQDIQSVAKPLRDLQQIQFGISYISSLLKQNGHITKLLVLSRETNKRSIGATIDEFQPRLICFSAIFSEYAFIRSLAENIKRRNPEIYLLAGGCHVTLNPEECSKGPFDALCVGEGEFPALELVNNIEKGSTLSGISNLWIRTSGSMEENPTRPFLEDLDSLPYPDRKIWEPWISDGGKKVSVLLGRGCPFQCTYCCNHALAKAALGKYVRLRSVANVMGEINFILREYLQIEEIFFEVETIALNKGFVLELARELGRLNGRLERPLRFGANLRVTPHADLTEVFAAFKECGFKFLHIGLESGSERVRSEVLKREYSNEDIVKTVELARNNGMMVCFFNLMGIPGETVEDFKETIRVNRRCLPDWHFLSIFFPYPGTILHSVCVKKGLLGKGLDTRMERARAALDLPGFSSRQIQRNYEWFDYHVYRGFKPLYKIIAKVLLAKARSDYRMNRFYRGLTNIPPFKAMQAVLRKY